MTAAEASEAESGSRYRFGVICIISAALFTSSAGILVRLVEQADGWQLLAYRQVSFTVFLFGSVLLLYRRDLGRAFRAIGGPGLLIAVALASAFCTYVFALIATSVADVVFVRATGDVDLEHLWPAGVRARGAAVDHVVRRVVSGE